MKIHPYQQKKKEKNKLFLKFAIFRLKISYKNKKRLVRPKTLF